MDTAVLTTDPYATDERRGEADEPTVGVVLRRTRLATHRRLESVAESCTHTRTVVHDILQHVDHLVGCGLADDLVGLRCEGG